MPFGVVAKRKLNLNPRFEFREVSVKKSLRGVFRCERDQRQLQPLMRKAAEAVSQALFLFQRHFELEVLDHKDDIDFFVKMHKASYLRDEFTKFNRLKPRQYLGPDITFPDLTGCSDLCRNQINQYEVSFRENIRRNMRKWIRRHYEFLAPQLMSSKKAQAHVQRLFSGEEVDHLWNVTVDGEVLNLVQLRSPAKMYLLLPALIRINEQIWVEQMMYRSIDPESIPAGLKTFNVVAQKKWGVQNVIFTSVAIVPVLNKRAKLVNKRNKELKNGKPPMKTFSINDDPRKVFASAFNYKQFERNDAKGMKTRFAERITTNGFTASIALDRRIDKKKPLATIDEEKGLDPGLKNLAGTFSRNRKRPHITSSDVRSARAHHQEAGLQVMNYKKHKWTKQIDIEVKKEFNETLNNCQAQFVANNLLNTDEQLIKTDLKHFAEKFKAYSRPKLLKLKFQHHIRTTKATDQYVSKIVGREKNCQIMYGNGWTGTAAYRRCVSAPLNDLYLSFQRHPRTEVHVVDEFRTSKLCPRCHKPMTFPKSPHRYANCVRCKKTYHREVSAAENILKNGIHQLHRMTAEDLAAEEAVKCMADRQRCVYQRLEGQRRRQEADAEARRQVGRKPRRLNYPLRRSRRPIRRAAAPAPNTNQVRALQRRQVARDQLRGAQLLPPPAGPAVPPPGRARGRASAAPATQRRAPGRPPGSKNKVQPSTTSAIGSSLSAPATQRRAPGRPPGVKNKNKTATGTATTTPAIGSSSATQPRGRGRPLGSKNKSKAPTRTSSKAPAPGTESPTNHRLLPQSSPSNQRQPLHEQNSPESRATTARSRAGKRRASGDENDGPAKRSKRNRQL